MSKHGDWYSKKVGSTHENSPNREAPNKHIKGGKKYKEKISSDSRKADFWKNLPFKFSKPPKRTEARRDVYVQCCKCLNIHSVNINTISYVCGKCKSYVNVEESKLPEEGSQQVLEE